MRGIHRDDEANRIDTFKKMLELNFPGIEIEKAAYFKNIAPRQMLEDMRSDEGSIHEALVYKRRLKDSGVLLGVRLCLPTQKGFTIVNLYEIVYCEAQRSYTRFHLINDKFITVSRPLFDYDSLLADSNFLRVHKSFLINLLHVREYARGEGGTIIMSNSMEIDVSRRRKEQFLNKIKEFFIS